MKNTDIYDIEVRNNQIIDGETGTVEERAEGSFDIRNGKIYIRYKAFEEETAAVSTTIIISGDTVTIKRTGTASSVMVYKKEAKTEFAYRMPYGSAEMEIYTKKLEADFSERGGELKINYTLTVQNEKYSNDITIRVKGR